MRQQDNFLAVYPAVLARLAQVEGVKAVKEVGDLADLMMNQKSGRRAIPLDGAVYVVYGGSRLDGAAGAVQKETLFFTFVLCKNYAAGKTDLPAVGKILTAVNKAFHGWDAGADLTAGRFARTNPPAIEYNDGFAFYPTAFSVAVTVR